MPQSHEKSDISLLFVRLADVHRAWGNSADARGGGECLDGAISNAVTLMTLTLGKFL